jgi:CxxC-x17-CxxC domain-containing protein
MRNFNNDEREKHDAVCAKCKKPCKVPFKPRPGSEVFCQECYKKIKGF